MASKASSTPKSTATTPLVIRRASLADARGIASLLVESFRSEPSTRWRCAFDLKTEEQCRQTEAIFYKVRYSQIMDSLLDGKAITRVATLNGRLVGVAVWSAKPGTREARELKPHLQNLTLLERFHKFWRRASAHLGTWVPSWLKRVFASSAEQPLDIVTEERSRALSQRRSQAARTWFPANDSPTDYLYLKFLATLPECQGKGIGSALLEEGCEMSCQSGVPVYLVASSDGKALYSRRGFAVLHEVLMGDKATLEWSETFMKLTPDTVE